MSAKRKCEFCGGRVTAQRLDGKVIAHVCPACKARRYTRAGLPHAQVCPVCGHVPVWVEVGQAGQLLFIHSRSPEGSRGHVVPMTEYDDRGDR